MRETARSTLGVPSGLTGGLDAGVEVEPWDRSATDECASLPEGLANAIDVGINGAMRMLGLSRPDRG